MVDFGNRAPFTVFVTHDQEEALEVADYIVVINTGRIEQIDTPDELCDQSASDFVMTFLGPVTELNGELVRPHDIELFASEPPQATSGQNLTNQPSRFRGANRGDYRIANGAHHEIAATIRGARHRRGIARLDARCRRRAS